MTPCRLLYADDDLVAFMDTVWMKGVFGTLTRLFDKVRLYTNAGNTVGVICRPYRTAGTQLETLYELHMTG